jgi:hypothetical protein
MQYVLTQAEYDELVRKQKLDLNMQKDQLQDLCTRIADQMPVSVHWIDGGNPHPWGCILTDKYEHYCDHCPVQDICPHEHKEWSK